MATKYTLTVLRTVDNKPDNLEITTESTSKTYQIKNLSYEKRLYSPCCVNVELLSAESTRSLEDIKKDFGNWSVTLTLSGDSGTTEIATDYFVYHYNVVYADSKCSVFLTLFSRDKLLTLDKFNKVYLNKQLGKGIIREMLCKVGTTDGPLKNCAVTFDMNTGDFDAERLQFLAYSITTDKGKSTEQTTWYEVIQPYRVQYNEDFYSFISRIACRCGEFLYFEDGKLKLGLDTDKTDAIAISGIILSKEYPGFSDSTLTVTNCFRNYLNSKTDNNKYSTASLPCSDYGAFDEYFDVFDQGVLPDKFSSEFWPPDIVELALSSLLPAVGVVGGKQLYTSSAKISEFAVELATQMSQYKINADFINNKFKKSVFENKESNTVGFKADQQVDGTKLSQFADVKPENYGKLMNSRFAEIRKVEQQAACNKIKIRVNTSSAAAKYIKLGSRITIDEKNVPYIVTSCVGRYSQELQDKVWVTKEDITEYEIVAKQSIPSMKQSIFVPPYDKCAESVPASPQIAIVTADDDPRYIGRVRVRYTWQNYSEKGSPWIRVLTPLASSSGAVHFQPKAGDEVLLGYIDGNIDRPYVAGSLFNDKDKIHDNLYSQYNDTIRVGSQRLDFRSGTMAPWVASFVPFAGAVTPFIPGAASALSKLIDDSSDAAKDFHGITRLTDNYGFWKIEGNTAARSVTIKSTYGKVTINAYTGIKIESAGDISIKGKNITISAQNNLHLESGVAIKNARKAKKISDENTIMGTIKKGLTETLKDLALGKIDLSLIRTAWESVIPPKEGTLKIKSNRYLALEAGKGKALDRVHLPEKAVEENNQIQNNIAQNNINHIHRLAENQETPLEKCISELRTIHSAVGTYVDDRLSKFSSFKDSLATFVTTCGELDTVLSNAQINIHIKTQRSEIFSVLKQLNPDDNNVNNKNNIYPDFLTVKAYIDGDNQVSIGLKDKFNNWNEKLSTTLDNLKSFKESEKQDILTTDRLKKYNDKIAEFFTGAISINTDKKRATVKYTLFISVCREYLKDSALLEFDKNEEDANKFIDSVRLKNKWYNNSKVLDTLGLSSDAEYEKLYGDSDGNQIAEGEIIMSQSPSKSIHITNDNQLISFDNITLDNIKNILKTKYPNNNSQQQELVEHNMNQ